MEVQVTDIRKHFGPVKANDGITLTVPAGTIMGILGENGAGKSTLMKILSGFQPADSGEIILDGKAVTLRSPADAIRHGVGMLHQDPLDFPPMRVVDNLMIGAPGRLIPRRADAAKAVADLAGPLGLTLDLKADVGSLTVGERQQLELLRLLWLGARVLILDEPTTGISAAPARPALRDAAPLGRRGQDRPVRVAQARGGPGTLHPSGRAPAGAAHRRGFAAVPGGQTGLHDVRAGGHPRRTLVLLDRRLPSSG